MPHMQRQQVCSRGQSSSHLLPLVLALLSLAVLPGRAAIEMPSNWVSLLSAHLDKWRYKSQSFTTYTHFEMVRTQTKRVRVLARAKPTCSLQEKDDETISWTKDGKPFDPSADTELNVMKSFGSFAFSTLSKSMDTLKPYKGKYVCYATNELGTAVSKEAILKTDVPPTQQKQKEKVVTVKSDEGSSIVLKCNPPQSSMEPFIHWMDQKMHHIQLSKRVVVGKDGNLYFAHLTMDDSRDDYTCNVQYMVTRTILAQEPITLKVNPCEYRANSVLRNRRPHMMRPTEGESTYQALRGQTIELECIVQGLPTPEITWLKKEGELDESRTFKDMFDRRLRLSDISESDSGEYQCIAKNTQGNAKHTYHLKVEVPLEAPIGVGVEVRNSTTIVVTWAAIEIESVRGHLLGYKIYLRRMGSRSHHQSRRSTEAESTVVEETGPNEKMKIISNLRPYSRYLLFVAVFNNKAEGPHSEPLPFNTEEGGENKRLRVEEGRARRLNGGLSSNNKMNPFKLNPFPPTSLILDSPSETEMTLHWTPPAHPNGILTGYLLQYQRITESDDGPLQKDEIDNPTITQFTLKGLDRHSQYRFYLRGLTRVGKGEPIMMTGATTLDGVPPSDISLSVGETSVNVSWEAQKRHRNVGFYIHYFKKNGGWKKSERVNSSQSFYQLRGLVPGSDYLLRFFYGNASFWETGIKTERTEMTEVQASIATQGWFIGVVSALALLLLILLILCFIKRSKGGKYSGKFMKDKEDGPMDSEARPMKEETFGEYSDLEEKRTASQPSLCEDNKMCSEDTLNFNGSSALTTELNLDESLASQISRPSEGPEGFHGLPDNSPLNPATIAPNTNGMPNAIAILD
ncbi:hypothetical protein CCH79_00010759 [Gambusia affinis]|uniref:Neural cell adhesion molecule L1 n=1 Tax=Gambusia affinis TaxID=33528 RepID=A0A315W4X3_GAMAF|nr:hypothetical protein CCH79_00010759 [Gambusia affinis]